MFFISVSQGGFATATHYHKRIILNCIKNRIDYPWPPCNAWQHAQYRFPLFIARQPSALQEHQCYRRRDCGSAFLGAHLTDVLQDLARANRVVESVT